jgi:serine/threonine protein kinase
VSVTAGSVLDGRYRIGHKIGEGGYGEVYQATELNLSRPVAVKVLHSVAMMHDNAVSRFEREAQLAKQLEHPNTVRLLDFGHTPERVPYIVYELLRGKTLMDVINVTGKLSSERTALVGMQVLRSLIQAHGRGLVHRDIKLSNIFVCDFSGTHDHVKVLDFGIAKSRDSDHAPLTMVGDMVGTASYMAPEQVRGEPVTPATDLYSLGLTLAACIHGTTIVKGTTPAMTALMHASEQPVEFPPSVINAPIGPALLRATQKSPHDRYASAAEMLAHMEQLNQLAATPQAAHQQITQPSAHLPKPVAVPMQSTPPTHVPMAAPMTAPMTTPMPTGAPPRDDRPVVLIAIMAALALVLIVVGGGVAAWLIVRAPQRPAKPSSTKHNPRDARSGSAPDAKPLDSSPALPPGNVSQLTARKLERKLTKRGWRLVSEHHEREPHIEYWVYNVRRERAGLGVISLSRYPDSIRAKAAARGIVDNDGMVVTVDGRTLVWVRMLSEDKRVGAKLLADATR